MRSIKLHFFRSSNGEKNFGDELSPLLVELITEKKVTWSKVSQCDMIGLGSIFEGTMKKLMHRKIQFNFEPIHAWGTGFIDSNNLALRKFQNNFQVHAVRGELSRAKINAPGVALGDPGILSKYLVQPQKKRIKVLIMPHIVHRGCAEIMHLKNEMAGARVADLTQNPIQILKDISSSDIVISSSLHGLICADSLGVANIRLDLSRGLKGGDYKFNDYNTSLNRLDCKIHGVEKEGEIKSLLDNTDFSYQTKVDELCEGLRQSFPKGLI